MAIMDYVGRPYLGLIICFVLLIINSILVAFEVAMEEVSEGDLEEAGKNNKKGAVLAIRYSNQPIGYLQAIRILSIINSILAGTFLVQELEGYTKTWLYFIGNSLVEVIVSYAIALLVIFVIFASSTLAAQKIGRAKALKTVLSYINFIYHISIIIVPLTYIAHFIGNLFVRLNGIDPHLEPEDVTEEEIKSMVNEGHEQGVLEANEAEMINNIFELGDKDAGDIMTHRKNIVMLSDEMTVLEALDFMLEGTNSRYPVYHEDADDIIGIAHIKDLMLLSRNIDVHKQKLGEVAEVLREAEFIPETRNIDVLFQSMQSKKNHMVIVVDEYGQTSGLVTMEDVLEEIVGNILDEYDEEEEQIRLNDDGSYEVDGSIVLEDLCEDLGIELEMEDVETLNGYLINKLDLIPEDGKQYKVIDEGYTFYIKNVENKTIQSVHVSKND